MYSTFYMTQVTHGVQWRGESFTPSWLVVSTEATAALGLTSVSSHIHSNGPLRVKLNAFIFVVFELDQLGKKSSSNLL